MVCTTPFGLFLKLWASGQSEAFLLLLLGFTVDVHTFCMLSFFREDKLNHFVFMLRKMVSTPVHRWLLSFGAMRSRLAASLKARFNVCPTSVQLLVKCWMNGVFKRLQSHSSAMLNESLNSLLLI